MNYITIAEAAAKLAEANTPSGAELHAQIDAQGQVAGMSLEQFNEWRNAEDAAALAANGRPAVDEHPGRTAVASAEPLSNVRKQPEAHEFETDNTQREGAAPLKIRDDPKRDDEMYKRILRRHTAEYTTRLLHALHDGKLTAAGMLEKREDQTRIAIDAKLKDFIEAQELKNPFSLELGTADWITMLPAMFERRYHHEVSKGNKKISVKGLAEMLEKEFKTAGIDGTPILTERRKPIDWDRIRQEYYNQSWRIPE